MSSSKKRNKKAIKDAPQMTIHDRIRLMQEHINLADKIGASTKKKR